MQDRWYQLVKSATGVDNDPRVVEARDLAANDLTTVAQSATTYLGTVYAVQVEACKAMINTTNAAERFAEALQSYSGTIISGVGSTDLNRWTPCITMLKAAFLQELEDLNFEFCARQAKAAKAKETKATLVATARQDAEMIDAIKPVGELISEEVKRQLAQQLPAATEKPKKAGKPAAAASTSASVPNPKTNPSTKRNSMGHTNPKETLNPKTTTNHSRKHPGANGGGGTAAKSKATSQRAAKGKAKVVEDSQDSDST
ncbi:hypothetical protein DFH07DRAFT_955149 [Mycena maculata]|uniref:Uncharacterized protein n=1 Tax=Mycena maculata TaxID=230809 RepID=A0AAD7JKX5_9AGAR|nr:hypothetical protein DFH07DRAFT_955149 [Mycena maculata]